MTRPLSPPEIEFNDVLMDGYHLSAHTFEALQRFFLLFSLFEAKLLNCEGFQGDSVDYAKDLISKKLIHDDDLNRSYQYFKDRYTDAHSGQQRYTELCGKRGGKLESPVYNIIHSTSPSDDEKLTACFFIAFRLRNNLFHGPKWLYKMDNQVDNLHAASVVLLSILRISRQKNVWDVYE